MIAAVDGCKAGWLVAVAQGWPPSQIPVFVVCKTFKEVLLETAVCKVVVVDMPIGLPETGARRCDKDARRFLGAKGAPAVFPVPPRAALAAKTPQEFQALIREINGVGAGFPVWGIVPRLREVDEMMTPAIQQRVKEYHPEAAWRSYAKRPLYSKHSAAGLLQRMHLSTAVIPKMYAVSETLTEPGVSLDDLMDVTVGLNVAWKIVEKNEDRFPVEQEEKDAKGLSMEIWY